MTQFLFNYANLPYAEGGGESDFNRANWKSELLLTRNQELIKDRNVLDLACNNGRMSYPCLALGAKQVTGVEVREELIEKGKKYLEGSEYAQRMHFVHADIFEYLSKLKKGDFDVILCLGFLYHTVKQIDFFREIKRIAPQYLIIETGIVKNYLSFGRIGLSKPPSLFLVTEDNKDVRNTSDEDGIAFWPTQSFLEMMFKVSGYSYQQIQFSKKEIKNWAGMRDFRVGYRIAYLAQLNDS